MDLVCYMILYEFDKKKMGFHANCGFEKKEKKRKKKKMVPPLSESLTRFTKSPQNGLESSKTRKKNRPKKSVEWPLRPKPIQFTKWPITWLPITEPMIR